MSPKFDSSVLLSPYVSALKLWKQIGRRMASQMKMDLTLEKVGPKFPSLSLCPGNK